MKIEETEIIYLEANPQTPVLLHRSGSRYFLQNHQDINMPLREIPREEAWDLLNVHESLREIMRHH